MSTTARFEVTGKLSDIQLEDLKILVNAIQPRHPHGVMSVREKHHAQREWLRGMGPMQFAVWLEYMLRNLERKDTIVYEGALQEWVIPEAIERLLEPVRHNYITILTNIITASKKGGVVHW